MPYAIWITGSTAGSVDARSSVRGTAVMAAVYFALIFHWVPLALFAADPGVSSSLFAASSYLLIVAGLAALAGVFGRLLHHALVRFGAPLWLALPVVWTAFEWTRAHLPDSLALPWLGLGTSLTATPQLVGAAELVGARGITFWVVAVNALVATARVRKSRSWLVAAISAVVLVGGWGYWRAGALDPRTVARVAVVQPDVARGGKVDAHPPTREEVAAALPDVGQGTSYTLPAEVDLVVLPELFLRLDPRSPEAAEAVSALAAFSDAAGAPVLFGGLGDDAFNSAFVVGAGGLGDFRYDKRRLVPVIERIPFQTSASAYRRGEGWPLAELSGASYGVLICYESSYPEVARALGLQGADVLVNITNDAWLEGPTPIGRSAALWQHPAHLVMRAIEGRIGVVRSAATGISMFVDPLGRVQGRTELGVRSVATATVQTVPGVTLYYRFGDVVGTMCAFLALAILGHLALRRPRPKG